MSEYPEADKQNDSARLAAERQADLVRNAARSLEAMDRAMNGLTAAAQNVCVDMRVLDRYWIANTRARREWEKTQRITKHLTLVPRR